MKIITIKDLNGDVIWINTDAIVAIKDVGKHSTIYLNCGEVMTVQTKDSASQIIRDIVEKAS